MINYVEEYLCDGHNIETYIAPYLKHGENEESIKDTKYYRVLKYKLGRHFTNNYHTMLNGDDNRYYGFLECAGRSKRGTGILQLIVTGQIFTPDDDNSFTCRKQDLEYLLSYAASHYNNICISYRFNGLVNKATWENVCIPVIYNLFAHNKQWHRKTCFIMRETPEEIILPPTIIDRFAEYVTPF